QEDCTTVSTDAAGYAAYIDQSYTHNILWLWLWLLMAVVFTGMAVVFRRTPVRRGFLG
ncbi:conjugal transfer protein TraP, partial [Klebsiella pneumoniae]